LALGIFKPIKSAVTDGILPVFLQQEAEHIVPHLRCIFRACMAYGFIHISRRQVKVTFIPKPVKLDYTKDKVYHPISLSSVLLKTMKKPVGGHIMDGALKEYPLYRNQDVYKCVNLLKLHCIMW
jgi:hypothetical protein